jgi:uroporphyrinogen-III synthase
MKKVTTLLDKLGLIYYEYDATTNTLFKDTRFNKDEIYKEKIKITYALTTSGYHFFVDENESIVISKRDSLIGKIKRFFKFKLDSYKNSKMDIYILSDKKVKWAKNLPMIEILYHDRTVDISSYDALIFTSKNAIIGIDKISPSWKEIPSYVIAPQTAKVLKEMKGKLEFTGKAKHGNEFAHEIVPLLCNKKVLYVRGKDLASDAVKILKENKISCDEAIVYETVCKKYEIAPILPKNSVIIFSSPSTIKCFFENNLWDESFTAIAIGHTTAKYFPPNIEPIISDNTSLEFCVKKAIEVLS